LVTYEKAGLEVGEGYIERVLSPYKRAIEQGLRRLRDPESELSSVASSFLESGGKRVRSCIALLTCEAVNGSYVPAMPIALAYELAHAASLTQDDIIDKSPTRHSQPTVHTKHGVVTAILVSDVLIFKIFEQLGKYEESALSRKQLDQLMSEAQYKDYVAGLG
jgi:geranylgeranyl pyrophosphate synthase